jgi:hypothetical protein
MIINLIITAQQQIRGWLNEELLSELEEGNQVTIWTSKKLESSIRKLTSRGIKFYSFEENRDISGLHAICLNIDHKSSSTFRSLIKEEIFWTKTHKCQNFLENLKMYIRKLIRNRNLFLLLIYKPKLRKIKRLIKSEIDRVHIDFSPSDLNIVVSSSSDLSHEIIIKNLTKTGKPFIQVMENWDNISSKVCPAKNAAGLVVWGEQTRRHAAEIHGFPIEKTHAFGSTRLNTGYFQKLRGHLGAAESGVGGKIKLFYMGFGGSHENLDFFINMFEEINMGIESYELTFRPHPIMQKEISNEKSLKYPELLRCDMPKTNQEIDPIWPILDYSIYEKLIAADIVIGTPSTFLLEAMLLNKRIILDYRKLKSEHSPRELFESRTHFREIAKSDKIAKLFTLKDLDQLINEVVSKDQGYDDLLSYLIAGSEFTYGTRLRNLAESVSGELNMSNLQ